MMSTTGSGASPMSRRTFLAASAATAVLAGAKAGAQDAGGETFAEKLGWPKGSRVVIFHSDDMGMCWEADEGTRIAMDKGLVTSASTMYPCAWTPDWLAYCKTRPDIDNGVHLTMTSEWDLYRWAPVAGFENVPGLADPQGMLWDNVPLVNEHASADEIEKEIRAQIAKAEHMGFPITHMDSHMGTLFSNLDYFERYVKVGIEKQIPVLITGPNPFLGTKYESSLKKLSDSGLWQKAWEGGLPVLDDATGVSYDWKTFDKKKAEFLNLIHTDIKPGVTEIIVHCNVHTETFDRISTSGENRQADLDVMIDADVMKAVKDEGIILTTWRELKERRAKVG